MAVQRGTVYIHEKIDAFRRFTPLLRELVVRDIKVRYRHSVLGLVWTVLNPLLMMVVITIVFSTLFKQNIPNFPIYYLSGSLLFSFNSESTTTALNSIISNASLIKKVYIPKYLFPFSNILSGLVNLGFSLIAMFIVMIITGAPFHVTLLLIPIPIFYTFLFSTGVGILLSALTVYFRDIAHFYGVFILAWTYFTPIWYPDGSYTPYTWLIDSWTPAGMLSMNLSDSVSIRGNLWMDWHIAPQDPS